MITVKELSLARGGLTLLSDLSFTLCAGKALVLNGPNGSGKTTLLRAIAGLHPVLSGSISASEDILAYSGHADGIKSMLTVSENLRFWAQVFGTSDIIHAVSSYGLEPLKTRLAGALSAGQKRRLGLARLLVTGRPLWILDEPTVSLDQKAVALFAQTIEQHLAAGGAALIATHVDLGFETDVLDIGDYRLSDKTLTAVSDRAFL
ncbi:MAG: heme ABC exporter ATP-binding protein CcmA [Pseudomonadota bacterium]